MGRYLDEARVGPTWLKREGIADLVAESIHFAADELEYYSLHAFVVMANHVHLLVTPLVSPSKLLQSVKGYSARAANKLKPEDYRWSSANAGSKAVVAG